jgi:hypothetical protein
MTSFSPFLNPDYACFHVMVNLVGHTWGFTAKNLKLELELELQAEDFLLKLLEAKDLHKDLVLHLVKISR